jgi:adenosine deaminase
LCTDANHRHPDVVVGIDFSGDARVNDGARFLPALKSVFDAGLGVTVHLGPILQNSISSEKLGDEISSH